VFESIFNWPAITTGGAAAFADFTASGKDLFFSCLTLLLTALILAGGVTTGIERWSKVLMPLLGAILLLLALRSLTLPGALAGVSFLFYPDFSKLGVTGILDALGHSFYSLSLGMGVMITYASYMKKEADLVSAAVCVVSMDTLVALLAGLAIFPAVFALGLNPGQGAGLAFITLPDAFAQMPGGQLCSALFFLLLFIAALTSIMSLMQVPLAFLEDEFKLSRRKSLALICALLIACGLPAVLSFGPLADWKILGLDYFSFLDRFANDILLPVTGLLGTLFIVLRLGTAASQREFVTGAKKPGAFVVHLYPIAVKYIAPPAIALILLNGLLNL
jgi:NSS family neurotransmitter:Na+ symporter